MIKLPRRPSAPLILTSPKVRSAQLDLARQVARGERLTSSSFKGRSYWGKTKKTLRDWQFGKCCYCERRRDANAEADVEHFRPKLGVSERSDHSGYWWLAYTWSNYLFACKACNSDLKKNMFPIADEACRALNKRDRLSQERPLLINPAIEDPAKFISYDWNAVPGRVLVIGIDEGGRGLATIRALALDVRDNLHKSRQETIASLQGAREILFNTSRGDPQRQFAIQEIKRKLESTEENAALARLFVARESLKRLLA